MDQAHGLLSIAGLAYECQIRVTFEYTSKGSTHIRVVIHQ
jgi:hypothetical protein